jgi:hypothetical protein
VQVHVGVDQAREEEASSAVDLHVATSARGNHPTVDDDRCGLADPVTVEDPDVGDCRLRTTCHRSTAACQVGPLQPRSTRAVESVPSRLVPIERTKDPGGDRSGVGFEHLRRSDPERVAQHVALDAVSGVA